MAALAASLVGVVQVAIGNTALLKSQGCSHVLGPIPSPFASSSSLTVCMAYKLRTNFRVNDA